jgi:hypothetical protein
MGSCSSTPFASLGPLASSSTAVALMRTPPLFGKFLVAALTFILSLWCLHIPWMRPDGRGRLGDGERRRGNENGTHGGCNSTCVQAVVRG